MCKFFNLKKIDSFTISREQNKDGAEIRGDGVGKLSKWL